MVIIYRNFTVERVVFSLTSGFHTETLMTLLKVKTSRQKKSVAGA